jgi:hypothetical protein
VPHISLVFREMWETTGIYVPLSTVEKNVKSGSAAPSNLPSRTRFFMRPLLLNLGMPVTGATVTNGTFTALCRLIGNTSVNVPSITSIRVGDYPGVEGDAEVLSTRSRLFGQVDWISDSR